MVLSCSCWKELAEVSLLGGPMPNASLIAISSSGKSLSLCLFSPWSIEDVKGVSLSLFLKTNVSSFCGVWRTEASNVVSCLGGNVVSVV